MSCTFVYKNNGDKKTAVSAKIENPLAQGGVSNSITFDKIVRNPFLENKKAVEGFLNIYSKKFEKSFGKWNSSESVDRINTEGLDNKQVIAAVQLANDMQNPVVMYKVDRSEVISTKKGYEIPSELSGDFIYTTNRKFANAHKPLTKEDVVVVDLGNNVLQGDFLNLEGQNNYVAVSGREAVTEHNGEPKLFFKNSQGEVFDSYSEAIKNTNRGNIEVGFIATKDVTTTSDESVFENSNSDFVVKNNNYKLNNSDTFSSIAEIDSNSDYTSVQGITNDLIKKDLISDQTVYDNGVFRLEAKGATYLAQTYNVNTAKQVVEDKIGYSPENVEVIGNRFLTIEDARPNTKVMRDKDGNKVRVTSEELLEAYKNGKLDPKYANIESIDENVVSAEMERHNFYEIKDEETSEPNKTEDQLKSQLHKIFAKLGVSVTTLEEYAKKYKAKYGTDPSIHALADIANKVVAFAEGRDTLENMTEEAAHFIIEAFRDQATVDRLASEVHTTEEWLQESDMYREKYREQAKNEEELDKMVRREILGKVLQNKILERNRKAQENKETEVSEENKSIFDKLLELFDSFVNRVRSFFSPEVRSEFESTLNDIADSVIRGNINDMLTADNIGKADQKTFFNTKTFVDLFTAYFGGLHFTAKGAEKSKLEFQLNVLRQADDKTAISNFLGYMENEIIRLTAKAESIRNGKEKIGDYDILSLTSILQNGKALMDGLKVALDKENLLGSSSPEFVKKVEKIQNMMNNLNGMRSYIYKANLKKLIQDIMDNPNYTDEFKKKAVKLLESELEKVGWWRNWLGIMTNSNNAFLQLMGKVVHDMTTRTNTKVVEQIKPVIRFYEKQHFNSKEIARMMMSRDSEGNVDGYIISNGKHAEYEKALTNHIYETYKKHIGSDLGDTFTLEDFEKNEKKWRVKIDDILEQNASLYAQIANEIEDFRIEHEEMPMLKEFYLQQRRVREILNLSPVTTNFLSSIRYQRWEILNKYRDKKTGKVNMQDISASDKIALENLNKEKQLRKSEVNAVDGSVKIDKDMDLSVELQKLDKFNAISFVKDKQTAIDEFNNEYDTNVTISDVSSFDRSVGQAFIDFISEVEQNEGSEAAFNTLMANGGFSFNDAFWNSFGDGSIKELLTNLLSDNSHNMHAEINQVLAKMNEKSQLLRIHTDKFNPSEINGSEMTEVQQEQVRKLEEEISALTDIISANVKSFREAREARRTNSNDTFESTTNDAYRKALEENKIEQGSNAERDFIRKHLTMKNKHAFEKFAKDLVNGNLTPSMIEFLMKTKGIDPKLFSGMTKSDIESYFKTQILGRMSADDLIKTQIAYGYTKLSSYYKRLAPKGFSKLMENMRNGTTSVASIIEQLHNPNVQTQTGTVLDFMKLNTEPSWMEDVSGNTMSNPNYKGEFNGLRQFKHSSKFYNKDFYTKMGIKDSDINEFESNMLGFDPKKAARKEFELWQKFITMKRDALDMYGMKHSSLFVLPQFSKGHINKWENILKNPTEGITNALKDLTEVRVDTQEYGAKSEDGLDLQETTGVRTIPKFGLNKLEEKSDISEELIYSYSALLTHAISYETKLEHLEEANAIGIALEHKEKEQGLDLKSSGRWAWQQSMDNFFYGISEMYKAQVDIFGRKIDIGKLVRGYNGLVSKVNLAFNPFVAGTSYTTAKVNLHLWKSDYFDKESYYWSQSEFRKLLPAFLMDTGKRMSTSRLAVLAEITGYDDLNERLKNASYNKLLRLAERAPQALNEMANIPIRYSILLATLDDVRFYKGNFIQSKVFFSLDEHNGKSKEQIQNEWKALQKDSVYNIIETKPDGSYEIRDDMKQYKDAFDKAMLYIAGMTRKANSETDGVLSKADSINVKRNFALSAILMHKTFLSLNIDKRFKKRHLNFTTGREEVGSYYRFWEMAKEAYNTMPNKSFKDFISEYKKIWKNLSSEEKAQITQLWKEWAVLIALLTASALVAGYADDDDNKDIWAIQAASYILFRTTSEFSQSHPVTGWKQIQETIQEPFVSAGYLKDVLKEDDFSFDEVQSGKYKGISKINKKLAKMWYFRSYFNLYDLHNTSVQYRKNNKLSLFGVAQEDKKEE